MSWGDLVWRGVTRGVGRCGPWRYDLLHRKDRPERIPAVVSTNLLREA
jgi:hypothetical protein